MAGADHEAMRDEHRAPRLIVHPVPLTEDRVVVAGLDVAEPLDRGVERDLPLGLARGGRGGLAAELLERERNQVARR